MQNYALPAPAVRTEARSDGAIVLSSLDPLGDYPTNAAAPLLTWAQNLPERTALADRRGTSETWRQIGYGHFGEQSASLGQALLELQGSQKRPVMVISENRIEAALLQYACYRAGLAVAPITPAYSSGRGDLGRLQVVIKTLEPGIVVIDQPATHLPLLRQLLPPNVAVVGMVYAEGVLPWSELLAARAGAALRGAEAAVTGDTIAKVLFTSGSTGTPKGAINTHRMLASNALAIRRCWPFLEQEPPILADWLPWNHTFGSNYVLNGMLSAGGTLYIDDGRPLPAAIRRSVENNAAVRPTLHVNAPRGLDMTARILSEDDALARRFFDGLGLIFFASAGLPPRVREHWLTLIKRYARREVRFVSAWGTTETAPLATALTFDAEINNIGVPVPGTRIKLAPVDGRLEIRVQGPNVSPGYLGQPEQTRAAFDEEGYFRTGDLGRLANPADAAAGILIEGRLAEDFKLASGTWVNVGGLRTQLLESFGAAVRDVVLSGPNRARLAALIFLDAEYCQRQFEITGALAELATHARIEAHVRITLERHNNASGSSRQIASYHIMTRALDPRAGELTEKGAVSQAAVLQREQALCDRIHARLVANEQM
jgi:feruloyl-CoA synthase